MKGGAITTTEEGVEEDKATAEVAAVVGACNVIESVIVIMIDTLRETGKVHAHQGRNLKHNVDDQERAAERIQRKILHVLVVVMVAIKIMVWRIVSCESKSKVHVSKKFKHIIF